MDIRGVSYSEVVRIVDHVSADLYGGNVKVHNDAKQNGKNGFRGRIDTRDSRAYGSRTSASGRRGKYASWEAMRDVLSAIFDEYPNATVVTAMARYNGKDGFHNTYPATAHHNVGSMVNPVGMRALSI